MTTILQNLPWDAPLLVVTVSCWGSTLNYTLKVCWCLNNSDIQLQTFLGIRSCHEQTQKLIFAFAIICIYLLRIIVSLHPSSLQAPRRRRRKHQLLIHQQIHQPKRCTSADRYDEWRQGECSLLERGRRIVESKLFERWLMIRETWPEMIYFFVEKWWKKSQTTTWDVSESWDKCGSTAYFTCLWLDF